jgi:membrane-associated phospholipid phosphatase
MYGQSNDSITKNNKNTYKSLIIPFTLIGSGAVLLNSKINEDIQEKTRHFFGENFHTITDNILPFIPIAQIYTGRYLGFQPKNTIRNQTIDIAVANSASIIIVEAIKHLVKKQRPDQSNNLSYPSGHSAVAFTNAALLFNEYKDSNLWYASSGFLFATTTGIFRIANNKHYASDVLTGAGIGLAAGIFVNYYNPFRSMRFGKNEKTSAFIFPQIGSQIGIGLLIKTE